MTISENLVYCTSRMIVSLVDLGLVDPQAPQSFSIREPWNEARLTYSKTTVIMISSQCAILTIVAVTCTYHKFNIDSVHVQTHDYVCCVAVNLCVCVCVRVCVYVHLPYMNNNLYWGHLLP